MANLSNKSGKLEIAKVNMSTCKEGGNLIYIYICYNKFFSILWCSQIGDYQQEDLAKFGCRPVMKVF
jgi:hypothetical protein